MMTPNFFISVCIIFSLSLSEETSIFSGNQLKQICSDVDAMVRSGLSTDGVKTFIRSEIEKMKRNPHQKFFRATEKDDVQSIDLSNNDEIAENGQLLEVMGVGSGSSMTDMSVPLLFIQANDKSIKSSIKQFQATIVIAPFERYNAKVGLGGRDSQESNRKISSIQACKDLIQAVYEDLSNPYSREIGNKLFDEPEIKLDQSRLEPMDDGEITSLTTNSEIKSDGLAEYILNVSEDRATGTSLAQSTEDQIHNNYKGSDVHLFDVAFALNA
ncbi:uncharacterized protein LOC141858781 [Brevipalpus obovatus]|uniref:uncharacterized protein LOC141858781 n=1 Tax=Brevipalpus obovatus TaxID=246614 RepID=UPI003D9DDE9B